MAATDWNSAFNTAVTDASNSFTTFENAQTQEQKDQLAAQTAQAQQQAQNMNLQRFLNNPVGMPPPSDSRSMIANIVLIGGIVIAGYYLLKFAKANRK